MTDTHIIKYGKKFYLDSVKSYPDFKRRLTLLKMVHPKLKYSYIIKGTGNNTRFCLYVRRWGL